MRQGGIEPPARLYHEDGKAVFYHKTIGASQSEDFFKTKNIASVHVPLHQNKTMRQGGIEPPAQLRHTNGKAVFYH